MPSLLFHKALLYQLKGLSICLAGVLYNRTQLFGIERFMQAQRTSDAIQCLTVRSQQSDSAIIGPLHEAIDFLVDDNGRLLAILARASCQRCASEWILALTKGDCAQALAHAPTRDHLARNGGDMLQIIFGSRPDVSNCHLLGGAATQGRPQLRFHAVLSVVVTVIALR